MSVTSEQNLWVIMYFSHCSFPSTIIEAVLESSSSSLGHRRMSQNQMWSSLPFEGTIYPLIFNVVIYMISFSCRVLVCFSVSPLPLIICFPFLSSSGYVVEVLDSLIFLLRLLTVLLWQALNLNRLRLWTLLPMKDSSSDFNFLLLTFLQAILSLLPACTVQTSETWAKCMPRIWGSYTLAVFLLGFPPHFPASEPLVFQPRKTADFLVEF